MYKDYKNEQGETIMSNHVDAMGASDCVCRGWNFIERRKCHKIEASAGPVIFTMYKCPNCKKIEVIYWETNEASKREVCEIMGISPIIVDFDYMFPGGKQGTN